MTLDQLRSFRAVIESGSFRAAAVRLHRTQPAVTHQIKVLEREAGHTLIERKTAAATPAGKLLYARACALLSDADGIRTALREFDETQAGELRLGTSDTTALYVLPPIVRQFRRDYPNIRVQIVNRPTETIAQMVDRGELDLGIVTLPAPSPRLEERLLFEQELVLVLTQGHPLAVRRTVCMADLRDEPFLLLEERTRTGRLLRDYFRKQDFVPHVVLDTNSFEVIKRYVAEGIGISFLPKDTITRRDSGLAVVRVAGIPRISIGAIWRAGAYRPRAANDFIARIETTVRRRRR